MKTGPDCKIYAIGGLSSSSSNALTVVEAYDTASNTWTTAAPMLLFHAVAGGAGGDAGRIYVIGGITGNSGSIVNTVEAYDVVTDSWATVASMPTARFNLAAATGPNGKIYAIGGGVSFNLNTVEAYTPPNVHGHCACPRVP